MFKTRTRANVARTITISIPADLVKQARALAKQESRSLSELFREAFRTYRAQRMDEALKRIQAAGQARKHLGYTPEEVERLVHEVRAERITRDRTR